jgi:hypothetical protein
VGDRAAIEQDRLIGERKDLFRLLFDHGHRQARAAEFAQSGQQFVDDDRRKPLGRLVERLGVIVADQLFCKALGDVGRAGVVLDLEDDLLVCDRVAMVLHVKLGAGALRLAGRGLLPVIGRIMPIVTVLSSARTAPAPRQRPRTSTISASTLLLRSPLYGRPSGLSYGATPLGC